MSKRENQHPARYD